MAAPRRGQLRRAALALTGVLLVHAVAFDLAETAFVRGHPLPPDFAPAAIPVSFAPPIPAPRNKAPHPAAPHAASAEKAARPPVVTPADVVPIAASAAAATGPGQLASAGGAVAGVMPAALPPDLVDPATTPVLDAPGYPVTPGYWEVDAIWLAVPVSYRYCLQPQNITRFIAEPCNHIYHCDYPERSFAGGKLHFVGVITNTGERYDVRGGGDYSPTHIHLTVVGAGHYHIVPVAFFAALDGHFLGPDCPANARRIKQP